MSGRPLEALAHVHDDQSCAAALEQLVRTLDGSGPALRSVPGGSAPKVPEEVALCVPTSGSTGDPKDVMVPADALVASARAALDRLGGSGRWVLTLPTTSIAGIGVLVRSLVAGTTPVVGPVDGFTVDRFLRATDQLQATRRYVALVPTQLWRVAAGPPEGLAALRSYDAVLVGGAALDADLDQVLTDAGVRLVRSYGMTETCGGCVYDGVPLDGVRLRASGDAPIELGGPTIFVGYRDQPALTAAALRTEGHVRWHVTNDAGRFDAEGRLVVEGRVDDIVITGGIKIAPATVQRALGALPGVGQLLVLGVPDVEWGQRIVAVVVPAPGSAPPTLDALRTAGAASLPRAALPRQLVVLPELPLLPSGKPDLPRLRALAK